MTTRRKFGNHWFKKEKSFTNKVEANKYIENARSYGEQVRLTETKDGYIVWRRVGDYRIY